MDSDKVDLDDSGEPKVCADCKTTKTPLWRGGPTGPKSLCNACGIRYRKKRRQAMGLDPEVKKKPKREQGDATSSTKDDDHHKEKKKTVEVHMAGFSKDAVLKQRRRMRRRKPSCHGQGEEERAAILLMALSSGVIYASWQHSDPAKAKMDLQT